MSEFIPPEKIKDVLITRTAIKQLQSEGVVEKVINFQFKDVLQMMKIHHQIEVSGFGKFIISGPKVQRRVEKMEDIVAAISLSLERKDLPESKRISYEKKLEDAIITLEYLKTRKNGYEN